MCDLVQRRCCSDAPSFALKGFIVQRKMAGTAKASMAPKPTPRSREERGELCRKLCTNMGLALCVCLKGVSD